MTSNESVALFHSIITVSIINSNVRRESTKISKNQYYAQCITIIFVYITQLLNGDLYFSQPKINRINIPKTIYVTLPWRTTYLITTLFIQSYKKANPAPIYLFEPLKYKDATLHPGSFLKVMSSISFPLKFVA